MKLTWLGHSAVRAESGPHVVLIDPFLRNNSKFEGSFNEAITGTTHVVLTHGHDDHVGDTLEICKVTGATLIAVYELAIYLQSQGVEKIEPANPGGSISIGNDARVTFVKAFHSSSTMVNGQMIYLGNPCGVIIEGLGKTLYHMGDTEIFGDMALVNELYAPKIGFVPIGDRFTMGAKTAALACRKFFNFETVIPIHYGTFPIIDQTPDAFIAAIGGEKVLIPPINQAFEI